MNKKNRQKKNNGITTALSIDKINQISLQQFLTLIREEGRWAAARLLFYLYIALSLITFGGFSILTLPIASRLFFDSWAFWRYGKYYPRLLLQGYRVMGKMLKDSSYKFLFSVPLTGQPLKSPDRNITRLASNWVHEENTCHNCSRCCDKIFCPLLDSANGNCIAYNTFYWRYFLCGRFPTTQQQLDYYGCPKWKMRYQEEG